MIVRKKKDPKVIIIEEKAADKPAVQPEKKPVVEVVEAEPEAEPAPVVEADRRPELAAEPRLPVSSTPTSPLYRGESGRSKIAYGGLAFYLNNSLNRKCSLNGLNENAIADAYEALCNSDYKPLLADCAQIRKDLRLNDWGVFTLVRQVADTYCGTANESIVMQQFLLNEMGYKARMARKATEDKMMLFVATDCSIYAHPYITLNGQNYYNLSGNNAKVTVDVPKALMDFYKAYPQCDYSVYFNAPVNAAMENRILSSLAPLVQGRNEADAANILINFVQTAFQYQTDGLQFGYEKPFFVEELFYYPYSDCEDRAMLFSYLVRKLLGLDVVLLDYPEHIATAVRFNGNVSGDYLMVNGRKYIVCDPTYIGASIGMTMPRYKTVSAKVLKY